MSLIQDEDLHHYLKGDSIEKHQKNTLSEHEYHQTEFVCSMGYVPVETESFLLINPLDK